MTELKKSFDFKEIASLSFDKAIEYSELLENALYDLKLDKYLSVNRNRLKYIICLYLLCFCKFKIGENFGINPSQKFTDFCQNYINELNELLSEKFKTDIDIVVQNCNEVKNNYYNHIKDIYNPWGKCGSEQLNAVGESLLFEIMKPTLRVLGISMFNSNFNMNRMTFRQKVSSYVEKTYLETQNNLYE